ncbi:transcription factor grauzone-like [Musca vetustissima]|uniref:transcription factor grauzone-like n=1 Tax=Musca vetustissima TaxID=27455 RepID=UPI002AB7B7B3|nr:transcription factor grauzone-like [Musca vetustissima]
MDICLLCLELNLESQYIPVASRQWHDEKIGEIIEKHFWPFLSKKQIASHTWLCINCWNTLKEFHEFYLNIENSHKSFIPPVKLEPQESEINIEIDTDKVDKLEIDSNDNNDTSKEILTESISQDLDNLPCLVIMKCEINNEEQIMENNEDDKLEKLSKTSRSKDPLPRTLNKKYERKSRSSIRQDKNKNILEKKEEVQRKTKRSPRQDKNKINIVKNEGVQNTEKLNFTSSESQECEFNIEVVTNMIDKLETNDNNDTCKEILCESISEDPAKIPCLVINQEHKMENNKDDELENKPRTRSCKDPLQTTLNRKNKPKQQKTKRTAKPGKIKNNLEKDEEIQNSKEPNFANSYNENVDEVQSTEEANNCDGEKANSDEETNPNDNVNDLDVGVDSYLNNSDNEMDECANNANTRESTFIYPPKTKPEEADAFLTENINITCDICQLAVKTFYELCKHFVQEHQQPAGKDAMESHQQKHKGTERPTVACNICGLKMIDPSYLKRHIATQHPEDGKKEFKCHLCPKVSPTLKSLKRHIVFKHETGYDFMCSICDKAFKKSYTLKEHMAAHSGTALYTCAHCPKTFNSNSNMHHHGKKNHPKEWEETCRARYSGNLPPNYKGPEKTTEEIENQTMSFQFDVFI